MLYLIVNENGKPEHRWSISPDKDFSGLIVIGEAIKNEFGEYEDSAFLEMVGGRVVINKNLRDQTKLDLEAASAQKELQEKADVEIRKLAKQRVMDFDMNKIKDADIKAFMQDVRILLKKWI